ncbi:MAG: sugar-binding protein [Anaerolineales bacterium]|nr:sugar-binding protein [Anaerolineales bacterium]
MRTKKIILLLSLAVLLALILTACAGSTPTKAPATQAPEKTTSLPEPTAEPSGKDPLADNTIAIAWIPKALGNPVFETGRIGAETKAKELTEQGPYKVEIVYTASVNSDIAEQARVVEDVISKGVDAIGISCNEPTGCVAPINKAVEAGIPVMTWDSDSPDSNRFTYLGVDNVEGGKAAAELLMAALPEGGKVAILTGVPGAANLEARITGFKEGVAGSNLEIVTTVACNDDISTGVQVVEETMQKYPDLNGWFFVGLWPLLANQGSMPQWEAASKAGTLKTVSFDTLPVELEFVKQGLVYGLVGQKYWGWGYDTVQMIYDKIVSGKTFDAFTNSGMDIVTAKNVDAMIEAWNNNDFTKPLPDWK